MLAEPHPDSEWAGDQELVIRGVNGRLSQMIVYCIFSPVAVV